MMQLLKEFDTLFFIIGRSLLGMYFLVPGLTKIFNYMSTIAFMKLKGVPLSELLLPITIIIQIFGGVFLILGKNLRTVSIILFCLTILINIYIHNFWDLAGEISQDHEMQNFVKNFAIAAGLLVLATKDKN